MRSRMFGFCAGCADAGRSAMVAVASDASRPRHAFLTVIMDDFLEAASAGLGSGCRMPHADAARESSAFPFLPGPSGPASVVAKRHCLGLAPVRGQEHRDGSTIT